MPIEHQSVTQVVSKIKANLEASFRQVSVVGEVSNFSRSSAGHCYFTLSDKTSSLNAVIFKADAMRNLLSRQLKDGDQIFCLGAISVYAKRGQFQLIVKNMAPAGKGKLIEQLEALKTRLRAEGLFSPEHKKKIPLYPKRVALITARSGAAVQDFINIYRRRCVEMDLVLIPSLVQGDAAAASLRKALHLAIKYSLEQNPFDVIVLTRGGGSLEDLWAFNDEGLAWDIFNCPVPVISAVGHEVDTSISDLCADLRCETPSAAAEVLTQQQVNIQERFQRSQKSLLKGIRTYQSWLLEKKKNLSPKNLQLLMQAVWKEKKNRMERLDFPESLERLSGINEKKLYLDEVYERSLGCIKQRWQEDLHRTEKGFEKLRLLDPKNVLQRGYCFTETKGGEVIKSHQSFKKIKNGEALCLNFHDGKAEVFKN